MRQELRRAVLERDDYTCQYCGLAPEYLNYSELGRMRATLHVDHMVPVSRGGLDDLRNLVTACESCNCSKRDRRWAYPIAYCAGCGMFERNPSTPRDDEILGRPIYVCEPCENRIHHVPPYEDEIDVEIAQWDKLAEAAGF